MTSGSQPIFYILRNTDSQPPYGSKDVLLVPSQRCVIKRQKTKSMHCIVQHRLSLEMCVVDFAKIFENHMYIIYMAMLGLLGVPCVRAKIFDICNVFA